MVPRWPLLFAVLPILVLCSGPDNCTVYESTFHGVSPELESLMCYNDYKSQVTCKWKHISQDAIPLELWNWDPHGNRESLCEPIAGAPDPRDHQPRLMRCQFNTSLFAISINHTFFFKTTTATSCSSSRHHLNLSQHLRVRPPADLARVLEDGDQLIRWSSPYPASSPLSHNLTYQLSYRREGQEWMEEVLMETHLRLRKHLPVHRPGCWYEARVRAMGASRGLWSEWSPLVTWKSPEGADHTPSMQCVLDGEEKVTCSWELRKERARFVTYQVECRHKQPNYISKRCCVLQEVTPVSRHGEALLRYSCALTSPSPEHLTLKLIPELNAKSFRSYRHICPNPPVDVSVAEKGGNWIVQWKKPQTNLKLSYQVVWNVVNEEEIEEHMENISEGLTSLPIKGASLGPSQLHAVRVRALLSGRFYTGLPSEWTEPKEWRSHAGPAWSPEKCMYVGLSALACFLFFVLFFSIQACRRKIIAWLTSGPSPTKSKLFLEIKNVPCGHLLQEKEILDVCRITHLDSFSCCSHSETGPDKRPKWQDSFSEDEGCLDCLRLTSQSSGDQIVHSETSAVSFNGPYIFCKGTPESPQVSLDKQLPVKKATDAHSGFDSALPVALPEPIAPTASSFRDGYVFLPNPGPSKPPEEPVTHGNHSQTTEVDGSESGGGQDMKEEDQSQTEQPSGQSNGSPPPYTPMQFTNAPQGGVVQPSGYCILP